MPHETTPHMPPKTPMSQYRGISVFFNGQYADKEVLDEAAKFGYEIRQYDSRLGR